MYAVVMFLKTLWDSHGGFYFCSRFLCFKQPIKKIRINSKNPVPRALRFSCQGPSRLREAKRAMGMIVSFAAVFSVVTQRSSPQTAAHIRTTFLSSVSTNHRSGYIFREPCAPKKSNQSFCLFHLGVHSFQNSDP